MLPGIIQTGRKQGMRLMDDSLSQLFDQGLISAQEACGRAEQKQAMRQHVRHVNRMTFEPRITRISRMGKMIHEELSRSIIGIAMEVLNELKPGLDEKLYERAMIIELKRCWPSSRRCSRPFLFATAVELIGNLVPDLIVDDLVIVDSKVTFDRLPIRTSRKCSAT